MTEVVTGVTRGEAYWAPELVTALDQGKCIGCQASSKVCPKKFLSHGPHSLAA
jgi:formate hydrogenlyase subunit 6/NADH:ubiquinone oxidoreductase subunit I